MRAKSRTIESPTTPPGRGHRDRATVSGRAAAQRHGLEVIDKDTAEALRRDAAEGRRIAAAAAQAKVEADVDDAIAKGKITAARRGHWVTLIRADPGMAEVLASVPNETAVPLTELGHSLEPTEVDGGRTWFYED